MAESEGLQRDVHVFCPAGHQLKTLMFKIAPGDFVEPQASHQIRTILNILMNGYKIVPIHKNMAESEGFEPSMRLPPYTLSRGAPSATRPALRIQIVTSSAEQCLSKHGARARYSGVTKYILYFALRAALRAFKSDPVGFSRPSTLRAISNSASSPYIRF